MKHQNLLLLAGLALVAGLVWMLVPKQPSRLEAAQPGLAHKPSENWAAAGELRVMGAARQALAMNFGSVAGAGCSLKSSTPRQAPP